MLLSVNLISMSIITNINMNTTKVVVAKTIVVLAAMTITMNMKRSLLHRR